MITRLFALLLIVVCVIPVKFAPLPKKVYAVQELAIETLLVILAIPAIDTVSPVDGNIVLTFKLLDMI